MGRPRKRRPSLPQGFVKLNKQAILRLDGLPPRLFKVYIKLLAAASWSGSSTGILGFFESPWSLRDIANVIQEDDKQLSKDILRLRAITMRNERGVVEPLVYYGKFRGAAEGLTHYYLPHYALFTEGPPDEGEE
ncbi:MAG: hypothetical protein PHZ19_08280 [Candidatus Thermoplasmatota archaeon]|nr:hypothetical protein [Candidatus Thermoplasmatota archaeon]